MSDLPQQRLAGWPQFELEANPYRAAKARELNDIARRSQDNRSGFPNSATVC